MATDHLPELVFLTPPSMGHLLPTVQVAERLVAQSSNRLSAVIPIMKPPYSNDKINLYIQSHNPVGLTFLELPPPSDQISRSTMSSYIDAYKSVIERTLLARYRDSPSQKESPPPQLSGIVLDYFCTPMIDIVAKLAAPAYVFFTCSAAFLSLMFRLEALHVDIPAVYGDQSPEDKIAIKVAGFKNDVPVSVWPEVYLHKDYGVAERVVGRATIFRRTKGILVNTFTELESSIFQSLSSSVSANNGFGQIPPIYPVGPIVNSKEYYIDSKRDQIINWLDSQPESSVVFLCFGSGESFNKEQVKEIATGLEQSGQRFLWSLRKKSANQSRKEDNTALVLPTPGEYEDFNEVLPEGFLERTIGVGKVIGWAPQVAVLSHRAVGAFVSHCGWNSTLESLWFGVPILTWPIWAEQQLNAFLLVKELGLAVEIKLDYMCNREKGVPNMLVKAGEVEKGIRKMMVEKEGEEVREKVKKMSEEGRKTLLDTGVSYRSMRCFLEDVLNNVA